MVESGNKSEQKWLTESGPAANGRGANEGERDWIRKVATESVLPATVNSDLHVKRGNLNQISLTMQIRHRAYCVFKAGAIGERAHTLFAKI